jgi:plastocyanin
VQAKVGAPVTWTFIGNHTISFNVPAYVPYYDVKKDGTVVQSESIYLPHGGWPGRTPPVEDQGGPSFTAPQPTVTIDAGKFDGSGGLKSSGVDWETGDKYQVTFTKPGTYPMACLVHPGMIGKVVVS